MISRNTEVYKHIQIMNTTKLYQISSVTDYLTTVLSRSQLILSLRSKCSEVLIN